MQTLVSSPTLLEISDILDEPVAGLDPIVTQNLYSMIKEINSNGITVIMVSHDMSGAIENASHILPYFLSD